MDSFRAGRLAVLEALESCPEPDVGIVFATGEHDQTELFSGVREVLAETPLVGCSAEGVIGRNCSDESQHAVVVMLLSSDRLRFETHLVDDYGKDSGKAGRELAAQVIAGGTDDLVGLLVLPDGLQGDCTSFLQQLEASLPSPSPVVAGGTAADSYRFERSHQYSGAGPVSGAVAALAIRGQGRLHVGVSHGCTPIGLERTITRAADGWIHEIDGQRAWDVFKEYLDGDPLDLNAEGIVHLCVGRVLEDETSAGYSPYIIRTPLKLDAEGGSLHFPGGGVETGQIVQLTRRDPALILTSARSCAQSIAERAGSDSPACVLQFDCAGRGGILFGSRATESIVDPLQEALDPSTPWIGFHTYGEIAPLAGHYHYHNYSVSLCALYEDPPAEGAR